MARRWIRLDVSWEDSGWLDALSGAAAGCWPRLLCTVKRDGHSGRCKRLDPAVAARRWRVEPRDVAELEAAAIADDALRVVDGDWVITNWAEYQDVDPTAVDRKRRQREREHVTDVTRDTPVTRHVTETVTLTETVTDTKATAAADGGRAAAIVEMSTTLNVDMDRVPDAFRSRLRAAAATLIEGHDRTAWLDPRTGGGSDIEWGERPAIFRLALLDCMSEGEYTQRALGGKVRYHAKRQLDPFPQRPRVNEKPQSQEPRTGRPVRTDGHDPEMEKRRREREDVERADTWAQQHPDEANAITADVAAEMGSDVRWKGTPAGIVRAAQAGEVRRRILEKLKPTAA